RSSAAASPASLAPAVPTSPPPAPFPPSGSPPPPAPPPFPTRRSSDLPPPPLARPRRSGPGSRLRRPGGRLFPGAAEARRLPRRRSEEHPSELQSLTNVVCRILLQKKNT